MFGTFVSVIILVSLVYQVARVLFETARAVREMAETNMRPSRRMSDD